MTTYRWTCRNVELGVIELLREVSETSGLCYGELVTQAIEEWYVNLPEEELETQICAEDGDA
jgi:hypothetical protein